MEQSQVKTYKDLVVWQKSFDLCCRLYDGTRQSPPDERFGLIAEIRKTARSVVYNIAEGHRRRSTIEYVRFLDIASGSVAELETQLMLAHTLKYLDASKPVNFSRGGRRSTGCWGP